MDYNAEISKLRFFQVVSKRLEQVSYYINRKSKELQRHIPDDGCSEEQVDKYIERIKDFGKLKNVQPQSADELCYYIRTYLTCYLVNSKNRYLDLKRQARTLADEHTQSGETFTSTLLSKLREVEKQKPSQYYELIIRLCESLQNVGFDIYGAIQETASILKPLGFTPEIVNGVVDDTPSALLQIESILDDSDEVDDYELLYSTAICHVLLAAPKLNINPIDPEMVQTVSRCFLWNYLAYKEATETYKADYRLWLQKYIAWGLADKLYSKSYKFNDIQVFLIESECIKRNFKQCLDSFFDEITKPRYSEGYREIILSELDNDNSRALVYPYYEEYCKNRGISEEDMILQQPETKFRVDEWSGKVPTKLDTAQIRTLAKRLSGTSPEKDMPNVRYIDTADIDNFCYFFCHKTVAGEYKPADKNYIIKWNGTWWSFKYLAYQLYPMLHDGFNFAALKHFRFPGRSVGYITFKNKSEGGLIDELRKRKETHDINEIEIIAR